MNNSDVVEPVVEPVVRSPRISVGMPVYNGERYLRSAIESVLAQSFGDFELIIADNASTDQTEAICREFAAQDARIQYIRNEVNVGAAGNYTLLFKRAHGQYFRWFNADDLSSPHLHERCLAVLEANPQAVMTYGKTDLIDAEGGLIEHYEDRLDLQHPSAGKRLEKFFRVVGQTNAIYGLMRASAVAKTNLMGAGTFPAADTNLLAELVLQGTVIEIPETLFYRRMHENASSWNRKDEATQLKFWQGRSTKFVMPTLKQEYAYWKAVDLADVGALEKLRMKWLVFRRMVWSKNEIARETLHALRNSYTSP